MSTNFRILESYVAICKNLSLKSTWNGLSKFQKLYLQLLNDDGKTEFKKPTIYQDRYFRK